MDINDILYSLTNDELNQVQRTIRAITREKNEDAVRQVVGSHQPLIGRCFMARKKPHFMFPEMWCYYKIISNRAIASTYVSVLKFDEYPTYWFDYQSSLMGRAGDFFLGQYDFNGIEVDDIPAACFDNKNNSLNSLIGDHLTEISLDKYNDAMYLYIERLQEMEWPADHYRFGNKMPTDKDWREEKDGKQ